MKKFNLLYKIKGFIFSLKIKDSIALKVIGIVSLAIILIMLMVGGSIYFITYNKILNVNKENMIILSQEISNNFDSLISLQVSDVQNISSNSYVKKVASESVNNPKDMFQQKYGSDIEKSRNILKNYSNLNKYNENIFIADKNGVIITCSNENFLRFDLSNNDYIKQALKGKSFMSTVYTSVISIKPVVTFVEPIKDDNGNILGVAGKNVFTDYFSNKFDKFKFLNSGYVFIVDGQQNTIYSHIKRDINKKVDIKPIYSLSKDKKFIDTKNLKYMEYDYKGKTYYSNSTSIPELNSIVVLTVSKNEIEKVPKTIGIVIIILSLILITIVITSLNLVIKKIFQPMNLLIKNTHEISNGNLTVINDIRSKDEVGKLTLSFNNMTFNLKNLLIDIKNTIKSLIHINDLVKIAQRDTAVGMEIINKSTENILEDTIKISDAVEWSFNSFSNIRDKLLNIKLKSEKVLYEADNIRKINKQGIRTIDDLKNINIESKDKMEEAADSFKRLNDNLKNIGRIVEVVTNISKQTHILSLNASIEAGRYGEMGRGFNVVAVEIKKLSQNIFSQMNKIEEIVESLNLDMYSAEEKMQDAKEIIVSQSTFVNNTIDNYSNMLNSTEDIVGYINDVDKSIESLNDENNCIYEKLNDVKEACEDFNDSIKVVKQVVEEQYEGTKNMNNIIDKMGENTDSIAISINKFTI
ncbi:methyl-accepting chemotaxis protein [Clostridium pasteurianum]|uniref:methyl-accepting chemotaxis protein n=1 Tax=Clostridium pasteurianum TaxID=1501 RepID=UPI002260AE8C|nr:methyl-accepting chemotaxis protein [Clostridium pasteurianum]UZW12412.1 methyl-accepting chemotaxis protein [Clostridium pasteurianum]